MTLTPMYIHDVDLQYSFYFIFIFVLIKIYQRLEHFMKHINRETKNNENKMKPNTR